MKLSSDFNPSATQVQRYEPGQFLISQKTYNHSVLLKADTLVSWRPSTLADVLPSDFETLIAWQPKIVLIGTGANGAFLPPMLLKALVEARVGFEVMTTAAACRTFALLSSEGRDVAAALCVR